MVATLQSSTGDAREPATTPLGALVAREILVSVVVNIAFNSLFSWLAFSGQAAITLWGWRGVAFDLVPATFMPAVMMTFPITIILRAKLRQGLVVAGNPRPPFALPRPLVRRALAVGIVALLLVALPVVGLLALFSNPVWTWTELVIFKLAFSVVHAAAVTPLVIVSALGHEGSPSSGTKTILR